MKLRIGMVLGAIVLLAALTSVFMRREAQGKAPY
jgi:Tfp pilus assembly protein PilW